MKFGNRMVRNCALAGALAVLGGVAAYGQDAPDLIRVSQYKIRANGAYEFAEGIKMVNDAHKKAGTPWRRAWQTSAFGETYTGVIGTPVKNLAQFDGPGPMAGLSAADSVKYQTLMRNSVESAHHILIRYAPELSLRSGTMNEPKFARVVKVVVKPGKFAEYEDAVRTILLPALQKAGIKDYWVYRTLLGGATGEYTLMAPVMKWAEIDPWLSLEKILGASSKVYMARVAETVDRGESVVWATVPELSYRTQ